MLPPNYEYLRPRQTRRNIIQDSAINPQYREWYRLSLNNTFSERCKLKIIKQREDAAFGIPYIISQLMIPLTGDLCSAYFLLFLMSFSRFCFGYYLRVNNTNDIIFKPFGQLNNKFVQSFDKAIMPDKPQWSTQRRNTKTYHRYLRAADDHVWRKI